MTNNRAVALWLAKNTNSKAILKKLVQTRNLNVLYHVLENKHADDKIMDTILHTYSNNLLPAAKLKEARLMIAEMAIHMPADLSRWVANTKDIMTLEIMARRHDLPYDVQRTLVENPESVIRYFMSHNTHIADEFRIWASLQVETDYKIWED